MLDSIAENKPKFSDSIAENERTIALEFFDSLNFAELPEDPTPEQMEAYAPNLLKWMLRVGDNGYKGEISGFEPPPAAENAYLWDEDLQQWQGMFVDPHSGTKHSAIVFEIRVDTSEESGYSRRFKPYGNGALDDDEEA